MATALVPTALPPTTLNELPTIWANPNECLAYVFERLDDSPTVLDIATAAGVDLGEAIAARKGTRAPVHPAVVRGLAFVLRRYIDDLTTALLDLTVSMPEFAGARPVEIDGHDDRE